MADAQTERILHFLLLPELLAVAVAFGLLVYSLVADTTLFSSYSRTLRLAIAAVLSTDLIAPVVVYLDMRLSGREVDAVWIHAATLPLVNVIGVAAYVADRNRRQRQD